MKVIVKKIMAGAIAGSMVVSAAIAELKYLKAKPGYLALFSSCGSSSEPTNDASSQNSSEYISKKEFADSLAGLILNNFGLMIVESGNVGYIVKTDDYSYIYSLHNSDIWDGLPGAPEQGADESAIYALFMLYDDPSWKDAIASIVYKGNADDNQVLPNRGYESYDEYVKDWAESCGKKPEDFEREMQSRIDFEYQRFCDAYSIDGTQNAVNMTYPGMLVSRDEQIKAVMIRKPDGKSKKTSV